MDKQSTLVRDFTLLVLGFLVAVPALHFPSYASQHLQSLSWIVVGALCVVLVVGILVTLFHQRILDRVFQVASTELTAVVSGTERLAVALAKHDVADATAAGADVARVVAARLSVITARRWVIGTALALLTALFALVGSALLFRQNEILEVQTIKLESQNQLLEGQNALIAMQTKEAAIQSTMGLTFEVADPERDPAVAMAARMTIGLRQLRDLYEGTNYGFFSGSRGDNIALMYSIRNWYYKYHWASLREFIARINTCLAQQSCNPTAVQLLVCPLIDQMHVQDQRWLTWDKVREPNADPLFPIHLEQAVKTMRRSCPTTETRPLSGASEMELFRSSAQYGELKVMLDQFSSDMKIDLPPHKAELRDNLRLSRFSRKNVVKPKARESQALH